MSVLVEVLGTGMGRHWEVLGIGWPGGAVGVDGTGM